MCIPQIIRGIEVCLVVDLANSMVLPGHLVQTG